MKKNLIKILALSAIVVSLGACNKKKGGSDTGSDEEVAKVVDIAELLTLDPADPTKWELEGQLVKLENVACGGKYGQTVIANTSVGNTVVDLRGVEIRSKEALAFTSPSFRPGYGADITAEGRVVNVNGRLVIDEATITINSQRGEDGKYADGAGLPVHYCPAASGDSLVTGRSLWDQYFSNKQYSGACVEGLFQLATVPATLTSSSEASSFKVVFPGEDTDATDPDNESLITMNIPAASDMSEAALTKYNAYFAGKAVGDFVQINGLLQYDSQANGGMGFIVEDYWNQIGYTKPAASIIPTIRTSWAQVEADYKDLFLDGTFLHFLDASATPESQLNYPFAFIGSTEYFDDPKGQWTDAYKDILVRVSDVAKSGAVSVDVNIKPSKMAKEEDSDPDMYLETLEDAIAAEGYTLDSEYDGSEGIYIYTHESAPSVIDKEILVMLNSYSQLSIYYYGPKAIIDYATFSAFKAEYESYASAKISGLTGAAFDFHTSLPAFADDKKPVSISLDLTGQSKNDGYYASYGWVEVPYGVILDFGTAAAAMAGYNDYVTKLLAAGFGEMKYADTIQGTTGLFKAGSNEFLAFELEINEAKTAYTGRVLVSIVIVNDAAIADQEVYALPSSDAELIDSLSYAYYIMSVYWGYSAGGFDVVASALPTSFTMTDGVTTISANHWDFTDSYTGLVSMGVYAVEFDLEVEFDGAITDDLLDNYVAALTTAGFVAKNFSALASYGLVIPGYYNSTSKEFVSLDVDDNTLSVMVLWCGTGCDAYFTDPA